MPPLADGLLRPGRDAPPRMASYEQERARYRPLVPERFNPVHAIVEKWGRESPDDPALISLDGVGTELARHTAADLARESRQFARALIPLGVKKGDRILLMLPRASAWYGAMLGSIRIVAVPIP